MKTKFSELIRFTQDYRIKEEIILRDHLAMERTKLANERTLLSYVRTSLYLLLGGLALIGLDDFKDLRILGNISLVVSVLLLLIGIIRFYQLRQQLRRFITYHPEEQDQKTNLQ
jgi:putative membrane protein